MFYLYVDGSAVFLSTAAFIHPFEHVSNNETKRMVQSYLAYLSDNTNLISNPGILVIALISHLTLESQLYQIALVANVNAECDFMF